MTESATCSYQEGVPLPKPEALPVQFDNIPQTLRDIPQWVWVNAGINVHFNADCEYYPGRTIEIDISDCSLKNEN